VERGAATRSEPGRDDHYPTRSAPGGNHASPARGHLIDVATPPRGVVEEAADPTVGRCQCCARTATCATACSIVRTLFASGLPSCAGLLGSTSGVTIRRRDRAMCARCRTGRIAARYPVAPWLIRQRRVSPRLWRCYRWRPTSAQASLSSVASGRPVDFADRHGAIERHYCRWRHLDQLVVQGEDL
jgi:hypothetical protein